MKRTDRNPADILRDRFKRVASWAVRLVIPLAMVEDPTDTGCHTGIWEMQGDTPVELACRSVGRFEPRNKMKKYKFLEAEKAKRLFANPGHSLSFQSWDESDKDPWKWKYPGAVRMEFNGFVISCSGFGWKFDELVCFIIGRKLKLISVAEIRRLAAVSGNEHAVRYFARMRDAA